MFFRTLRKCLWARGLALLLSTLVCGASVDGWHAGGDDPDCSPVVVVHNHAAHRISTGLPASSPEGHCFICHTLRLLHAARTARTAAAGVPSCAAVNALHPEVSTLKGVVAAHASRGPPAGLAI